MLIKRLPGLWTQERLALRKLQEAFDVARNQNSISLFDRQVILPSEIDDLNAANPHARILLGNALWSEFSEFFGLSESQPIPEGPLFWLTLVDIGCMTALDARHVDIAGMIRLLRTGLRGLSYIGVIDPGLYANIQPGTNYRERTGVNWHLHLFAWGEDRRQIKARAKRMNELPDNYRPIVKRPQGEGFNWSQITEDNITRRFRYMCKTPHKAYRIGPTFIQGKSDLRHGQRITLFHLLKKHWLDALLIAGGEGVAIRRRAIRSVLLQSRNMTQSASGCRWSLRAEAI